MMKHIMMLCFSLIVQLLFVCWVQIFFSVHCSGPFQALLIPGDYDDDDLGSGTV
jgi:hypothetical protein